MKNSDSDKLETIISLYNLSEFATNNLFKQSEQMLRPLAAVAIGLLIRQGRHEECRELGLTMEMIRILGTLGAK